MKFKQNYEIKQNTISNIVLVIFFLGSIIFGLTI